MFLLIIWVVMAVLVYLLFLSPLPVREYRDHVFEVGDVIRKRSEEFTENNHRIVTVGKYVYKVVDFNNNEMILPFTSEDKYYKVN